VQAGHLVVDHRDADGVVAAGDVTVKHLNCSSTLFEIAA
jgi:hypothetical protein